MHLRLNCFQFNDVASFSWAGRKLNRNPNLPDVASLSSLFLSRYHQTRVSFLTNSYVHWNRPPRSTHSYPPLSSLTSAPMPHFHAAASYLPTPSPPPPILLSSPQKVNIQIRFHFGSSIIAKFPKHSLNRTPEML